MINCILLLLTPVLGGMWEVAVLQRILKVNVIFNITQRISDRFQRLFTKSQYNIINLNSMHLVYSHYILSIKSLVSSWFHIAYDYNHRDQEIMIKLSITNSKISLLNLLPLVNVNMTLINTQ